MGVFMLDYLIATSLLLLIIAQVYIARGCFKIQGHLGVIPEQSEVLGTKFEVISSLLDEAVEVLVDISGNTPKVASNESGSPFDNIVNSLISNMIMPKADASKQEQEDWEILPPNKNPQEEIAS